jgi:hypothetical protein
MSEITQPTARALLGAARALLREWDRPPDKGDRTRVCLADARIDVCLAVTQAETELAKEDEPAAALDECSSCGLWLGGREDGHRFEGASYCGRCFETARKSRGLLMIITVHINAHWNKAAAFQIPAAWVASVVSAPAAYTGPRQARGHTRDAARSLMLDEIGSDWQIGSMD